MSKYSTVGLKESVSVVVVSSRTSAVHETECRAIAPGDEGADG
jgi:hypothetical protein